MNSFDYRRATSAAQATAWLREDPDAKLLAGGQSLLAAIKLRLAAPSLLIDLQGMPELQAIREDGQGVWIGAMCTHASAAASPLVRKRLPMIARLAQGIADQQVRNRGTMGDRWPTQTRPPAGLRVCWRWVESFVPTGVKSRRTIIFAACSRQRWSQTSS